MTRCAEWMSIRPRRGWRRVNTKAPPTSSATLPAKIVLTGIRRSTSTSPRLLLWPGRKRSREHRIFDRNGPYDSGRGNRLHPQRNRNPETLTERETEVLRAVALGRSNKSIADALFIGATLSSSIFVKASNSVSGTSRRVHSSVGLKAWCLRDDGRETQLRRLRL